MGTHCVTGLWITLTILFTTAVIFSLLSPVWFQNSNNLAVHLNSSRYSSRTYDVVSFGLLRYCRHYELEDVLFKCQFFRDLNSMPSIAWIITTIIFTIGAGLFVLSVILSPFGMCTGRAKGEKLRIGAAYVQIIGVGFLAIAVLMFPLSLDSDFSREVCGPDTTMFLSGDCQVAWGYVLGIMAISLTVFCPILAKYSTEFKDDEGESDCDYKSEVISISPSSNSKVMTTV